MTPKEQALKLAKQINELSATPDDKFAIAAILIATGLGIASNLLKSGKIIPMRGLSLVEDLREWTERTQNELRTH